MRELMTNELSGVNAGALALAKMPNDKFSVVLEDLSRLPLALSTADDVFEIIRGHDLLNAGESNEFDEEGGPGSFILLAFYRMADRGSKTVIQVIDDFADRVSRVIADESSREALISLLRARLESLGGLESIITSVKATLLNSERDKAFLSSRVLTDLRPVLNDDSSIPPMLIINTLKLEIRDGKEKRVSYISLDKQDIDTLIEQLERARSKSDLIATALRVSQTKIIE
jgi:hypothetical protein